MPTIAARTGAASLMTCGFVGTVAAHKGIDILLDAFATLEGASLAVHGEAAPQYLALAGARNVRFIGEMSEAEKPKAFEETDVLIVPSIWFENHPLAMAEAFPFGVPVIASDIGALRN